MRIRSVAAVALCALPLVASAHVAPSVDENNRYLRVSALGDRVRLAYTMYVGEVPGAQARRRLDANRDGLLDEEEANAYGRELALIIGRSLTIELDGGPLEPRWSEIHVGLGTPSTNAGSFSVDLIAWLCVPDQKRLEHELRLRDHFRVPQLGETEVLVEESPGVTVTRSVMGDDAVESRLKMQWRGDRGYLREKGLHVEFSVDPALAVIESPAACERAARGESAEPPAERERRPASGRWLFLGLAALAGMAGLLLARRYRKTNG